MCISSDMLEIRNAKLTNIYDFFFRENPWLKVAKAAFTKLVGSSSARHLCNSLTVHEIPEIT